MRCADMRKPRQRSLEIYDVVPRLKVAVVSLPTPDDRVVFEPMRETIPLCPLGSQSIAPGIKSADNCPMMVSAPQRRIERAQELANQHPFATEILGFFI